MNSGLQPVSASPLGVVLQSIVMNVCCLYVCPLTYLKNHTFELQDRFWYSRTVFVLTKDVKLQPIQIQWNFRKFSVCVNCGRGLVLLWRQYNIYVALSSQQNRAMTTVLWMTSCLPIVSQAKATPTRRILKVTHQGPGAKSTIALFLAVWATVCKTVRPMLSDRCLSCLWRWCVVA